MDPEVSTPLLRLEDTLFQQFLQYLSCRGYADVASLDIELMEFGNSYWGNLLLVLEDQWLPEDKIGSFERRLETHLKNILRKFLPNDTIRMTKNGDFNPAVTQLGHGFLSNPEERGSEGLHNERTIPDAEYSSSHSRRLPGDLTTNSSNNETFSSPVEKNPQHFPGVSNTERNSPSASGSRNLQSLQQRPAQKPTEEIQRQNLVDGIIKALKTVDHTTVDKGKLAAEKILDKTKFPDSIFERTGWAVLMELERQFNHSKPHSIYAQTGPPARWMDFVHRYRSICVYLERCKNSCCTLMRPTFVEEIVKSPKVMLNRFVSNQRASERGKQHRRFGDDKGEDISPAAPIIATADPLPPVNSASKKRKLNAIGGDDYTPTGADGIRKSQIIDENSPGNKGNWSGISSGNAFDEAEVISDLSSNSLQGLGQPTEVRSLVDEVSPVFASMNIEVPSMEIELIEETENQN
ncbi:hypothetical protein RUND412_007819 [Rhizina undulata]